LVPLAEVEIVDDWQVRGLRGTGSKSLVLRDVFVPEHHSVMVSDLFAGTPPGALVHPDYPVLRAPRGFLVSYSLPPVAIALGRRALDIACAALAGRVSRRVTRVPTPRSCRWRSARPPRQSMSPPAATHRA
jgi:alkylation response protein AidB-like acyl-CoA dehydrogenase